MGFGFRTASNPTISTSNSLSKTAIAVLLASTIVLSFEGTLSAEDGSSCVLNQVKKEVKDEEIQLSAQFKSGIKTLKTLSPEVVAGNQTPTWEDFKALQNVLSSFRRARKSLKNQQKIDELDRTLQYIANSLKSDPQIQALREAKLVSHDEPYQPGEYGLKLSYQQLVRQANDLLPPDLRLPTYQLRIDDRLPKLTRQGHAAVVKQEKRFAALLATTGFKSLKGLRTALREFSPVAKQLAKDLDEENVEFAMNRPEGARWWAPKTGFLNQRTTKSSQGSYDPDFRDNVESSLMGISPEDYKARDSQFKPIYGYLRPKPSSALKQSEDASGYGSDTYVFKPEVVREYVTFTSGDSFGVDSSTEFGKTPASWRAFFIPWKYRLTVAPDLIESAKQNQGFTASIFKSSLDASYDTNLPEPEAPPSPEYIYTDHPYPDYPTEPEALRNLAQPMPPQNPAYGGFSSSDSSSESSSYSSSSSSYSYSSSSYGGMGTYRGSSEMDLGPPLKPPLIPPLKRGQTFKEALALYQKTPSYREFAKKQLAYKKAEKAQRAKDQEVEEADAKKFQEIQAAYEASPEYKAYQAKQAEYEKEFNRLTAEFQATDAYKKYAAELSQYQAIDKENEEKNTAALNAYKKTPIYLKYKKDHKAWEDQIKAKKAELKKSQKYLWYQANKKIDELFRAPGGPKLDRYRGPSGSGYVELQFWRPLGMEHLQKFIFTENPPSGEFLLSLLENHVEIRDARTEKDNPPLWQPPTAALRIAQRRAAELARDAATAKHP